MDGPHLKKSICRRLLLGLLLTLQLPDNLDEVYSSPCRQTNSHYKNALQFDKFHPSVKRLIGIAVIGCYRLRLALAICFDAGGSDTKI